MSISKILSVKMKSKKIFQKMRKVFLMRRTLLRVIVMSKKLRVIMSKRLT